ncbi:hypothetical protein SAMN04488065_1594 [Haloplanus vescus]|uniref:Uncharacterized protein n=1 Tax=Haloplanus vescus TaxID=555874 RepID=A0A1H3Y0K5_9EURY|nr:hypothetical protein [Haloplanus vescus]SEA05255.1 hypothetical protein SAMN04488065_1594 [Haloplanus vescus]
MRLQSVGDRLRRPEYTGENRCLPCTVVNVCLALIAAGVVTVGLGPVGGLLVFTGALSAIYFRGYLVPGTPELTMRYFPPWLLELFGKELELRETLTPVEGVAVRATPEGGRLVGSFAAAWDDRIETMRERGVEDADVATLLGVDEASSVPGDVAYVVDGGLRQWLSESALLADAAAAAILDERGGETWASLGPDERVATLRDLRKLLGYCPLCDGDLVRDKTETVETCCTESERVLMATCSECDVRLIEDLG